MNVRESARERVRGWGGQRKRVRKCQYQSVGSCVKKIVVAFPAIPVKAQYLSVQVHTYQYECTCTFGTKYQTTLRSYNRRTERLGSHNACLSDKCLPVLGVTHQLHPADMHLCDIGRYQQKLETAQTMHAQKIRSAEDEKQLSPMITQAISAHVAAAC